jgi:hypothetical protein
MISDALLLLDCGGLVYMMPSIDRCGYGGFIQIILEGFLTFSSRVGVSVLRNDRTHFKYTVLTFGMVYGITTLSWYLISLIARHLKIAGARAVVLTVTVLTVVTVVS